MTSPHSPFPSFEGHLGLQEHSHLSTRNGRAISGTATCPEWVSRWCTLENGTVYVYADRTAAEALPEKPIRSISLAPFQQLKTSCNYGSLGIGQWELTLLGENFWSSTLPLKLRALPRSSTSASLSNAFERGPNAAANQSLRSNGQTQWSEGAKEKGHGYSNTWHNRFASKSKRLYQLVSGSGSAQSLSDHARKSSVEGSESEGLSRPSSSMGNALHSVNSTLNINTSNSFAAPQFTTGTKQAMLILQATDAQSMNQWAEVISSYLYIPGRSPQSPSSSLASTTSFHAAMPAHARPRRPCLASVTDEFTSVYGMPSSDSSLVSAAMASRRKREDSAKLYLNPASPPLPRSSSALPLQQPVQSNTKAAPFTAADRFIKARRRISAELFSATLGSRRSGEGESGCGGSRPTTSSGASTRSSICCAGEVARLNMDRSSRQNDSSAPLTSFLPFSPPNANSKTSASRRSGSIHSTGGSVVYINPTSSSNAASSPLAPSPYFAPTNDLPLAGDNDSRRDTSSSPSSGTVSTFFSPSPQTPSMRLFEGDQIEEARAEVDQAKQSGYSSSLKGSMSALGLSLHHSVNREAEGRELGSRERSAFHSLDDDQHVIVESPTKEDLATLIEDRGVAIPKRHSSKLMPSPSMPSLHCDYAKVGGEHGEDKVGSPTNCSSPSRFSTFTKFSARRAGLNVKRLNYSPKPSSSVPSVSAATSPHSPPGCLTPATQRPSTASSYWSTSSKVGSPAGEESEREGEMRRQARPPVVERILPPEEMIATFDRLKGSQQGSQPSHLEGSSSSSYTVRQEQTRGRAGLVKHSSRPRTSPALAASLGYSSVPNFQDHQNDGGVAKMDGIPDVRSLPAPPRLNRKSKFQREQKMEAEDKENSQVEKVDGKRTPMAVILPASTSSEPLRSSISECFTTTMITRAQSQVAIE